MIQLIEDKREAIEGLCRKYRVAKLEVFGSAADGTFDPTCSDVDFLVEFLPGESLGPWFSHYFDLKAELETLLERNVDLVMPAAMRNPYFIRQADRTRRTLYAA